MSRDDPIADRVLSESPYDRLRVQQFSYFAQSVDRKLAWQSYLLFALALLLPVLALTPASIRQEYFADVATATPKVAFVALVATVLVAGAGVGLSVTERVRLGRQPLDERTARDIVTFEELFSVVGFGTGGFATFSVYALVLLGFGGHRLLDSFLAVGGGNPFASSNLGATVGSVAVTALICAVVFQFLSAYFYSRRLLTEGALSPQVNG